MPRTGMAAGMGFNFLSWNWLPLFPIFMVYLISGVAETNRHPFDVVEGESEIVAGHMVEYSGMGFAIFFLAEYASMWLVSILAVIMFLGGWMSPIDSVLFNWIPGWIWLGVKTFVVVSMFIWSRQGNFLHKIRRRCIWSDQCRSVWCGVSRHLALQIRW